MIKFGEHFGVLENVELPSAPQNEITLQKGSAVDKTEDYWNDVFSNQNDGADKIDDAAVKDVYGYYAEDFAIDFTPSPELLELAAKFHGESWSELDAGEKQDVVNKFADRLATELNIENKPRIEYYTADKEDCGAYDHQKNQIELNRALLEEPAELVDTVAHEMRHAYQNQCAENPQSITDLKYKYSFDNYVSPLRLLFGKYLFITDYQNQYVEAEACAFAKLFANQEVAQ